MFHKTSLRLTGLYLTILMVISLSFSMALYSLAMREFDRGFRRQDELIDRMIPPDDFFPPNFQSRFIESREMAAREAKARILSQLVFANLAVLVLGGGFSYFLARRTLEPIERAHTSLEQFTADASHELRTPIAAMKSEIEVALLQPKLASSEVKELLSSNLEELDRLTLLTEGLLSIARNEEKPLDLKKQALKPIIEAALKKAQPLAAEKNIIINPDFGKKGAAVTADKHSLVESLLVLLDNAIKYSNQDATIELKARQKKDHVIISVIDHGIGIAIKDLPHVFERFYRADVSRAQTTKGHGLGLAIAKQLIERQNGTLTLTSKPNQSTTATITLPI